MRRARGQQRQFSVSMDRFCRTMMCGYRLAKSNSSTRSCTPTGGRRMTPPRSAESSVRALLNSSGRFFFHGTCTPSARACAISIAVKQVPGDWRATVCSDRRESRAASSSPSTAASSYSIELARSM